MVKYLDVLFPDSEYLKGKAGQTDPDKNGEKGTGSVYISTYGNGNHNSGDCNQKFRAFLDSEEYIVFNFNENNITELCKKCEKLHEYISNIEDDLKECNSEKSILIDFYENDVKNCKERCDRESERLRSALPHVESTDELPSKTEKPSIGSKNEIESKKEDAITESEFPPKTSGTVTLGRGNSEDETSNKSLSEKEHQHNGVSSPPNVVKPTPGSNENESNVPESLGDSHRNLYEQKETTVQSSCASEYPLKGELDNMGCYPRRMSSQTYDAGDGEQVNSVDKSLHLSSLPNSGCDTEYIDKIKVDSPHTAVTGNSNCVTVENKEHPLTEITVETSVRSSTHQGDANEVDANGADIGDTYTTSSHDDETHVPITVSDHGTSSDTHASNASLDNEHSQDADHRSEVSQSVEPKSEDAASESPSSRASNEKDVSTKSYGRNSDDAEDSVNGATGNEDSGDECAKNSHFQGVPDTAANEELSFEQKNSDDSSISSSTHTLSGSSRNNTVDGIIGVSGSNTIVNNGVTGQGIVQHGSGDNEEGISYKNYMIMILVPLAIILIMTLLVKFTPLGMFFTKKKKKKRKQMNEKLQKVLLDRTPTTEKRVHLAYSYS